MNVAVPSAQHSDRLGHPASSHTVTSPSSRTVRLSASTSGPWRTLGRSQSGLRVSIDSPDVTPAAASRDAARTPAAPARPGPAPRGERREVLGAVAPRHVLALGDAAAPPLGGQAGDGVDDVAHRHVDALLGERGDRAVVDAAGDDVLAQVGHVGRDVEGEAVHRAPALQPHADGADLARARARRRRPTRPGSRPAGRRVTPNARQRVDDQLLDVAHVLGGAEPVADVDDRIADELARAVVGDVAAAADADQLGADGRRIAAQVVAEVRARPVREHVRVLEQQQVLLATP